MGHASKKHLVVLTGAGISAESGLKTFRDSEDGLWNGYDIEEVATPGAWERNPTLVLEFYNYRRAEVLKANPNEAHRILAELEQDFRVSVITQNIDDLHERAGSTRVLHLHGEIFKMRSEYNEHAVFPIHDNMMPGAVAEDGGRLRPHIVWFGEAVPLIGEAADLVAAADYFAVVGTSLAVYPAAGLIHYARPETRVYVVDKKLPTLSGVSGVVTIEKPATLGLPVLRDYLLKDITSD